MGQWKSKTAQKVNFGKEGNLARDPSSREIAKGELLEGRITLVEDVTLGGKSLHNYTLETVGGELVTFLGTASLDRLIKDEEGSMVRITYAGDAKSSSGFNVKQFDVQAYREDEAEEAVRADSEPELPFETEPKSKK